MRNPRSQVSGSSISQIPEPPDIKQWFSSYNYQSPELDTNEAFCLSHGVDGEERGLYVEDSETEDEGECEDFTKINRSVAIRKFTEEANKHDSPTLPAAAEAPANPDSLSPPSEPPDIKNWFSSYVYESPELDSAGFDVSLSSIYTSGSKKEVDKGREDRIKELPVTKVKDEMHSCRETIARPSGVENSKNPSPQSPQVPSYPDSLSLLSEPPDITKWFSSYVYESPNLESADFDVSSSSVYTFGSIKEVENGREDHLKEFHETKFKDEIPSCRETITRPSGVQENKIQSAASQEDGSESKNSSLKKSLCLKRTSVQKTSGIELNNKTFPDKSVVCQTIVDEPIFPILQDEQKLNSIKHLRSPAKAPYCGDRRSTETVEEKAEKTFAVAENGSGWISLNHKPREEYSRSITEKRGEFVSAENQFTMKNKTRPRIDKENSPANSVYSSDGKKDKRLRREVLKETTNFNCSRVPEVAGKWKCPQRYKPNTGPPLKQLRLERWIHKI